jgi:plasmid stabilization system protein ParE
MALRYFPAAREDIKNVLRWSAKNFGPTAAQKYKALIRVAMTAIDKVSRAFDRLASRRRMLATMFKVIARKS